MRNLSALLLAFILAAVIPVAASAETTGVDFLFDLTGPQADLSVTKDDGHVLTHSDIVVFDVSTGDLTKLTTTQNIHEMNPKWSPDGNWIAYDNALDGRIWAIQVERN